MPVALLTFRPAKGCDDQMVWSVRPGECWAVLGPAGSGKGKLLGVLAGTERGPGRITYYSPDGLCQTAYPDPSTLGRRQIARVRFADQRALLGHDAYHQASWNSFAGGDAMTVDEALSSERIYCVSPYQVLGAQVVPGDFAERRRQVIEALGITALLDRKVMQLSNGERRKVMLARALVQRPRLLLLEDPFAGLDSGFRERLHEILGQVAATGTAVVFSTPRAGELGELATHVAVLRDGCLHALREAEGTVLSSPADPPSGRPAVTIRSASSGIPVIELQGVRVQYGQQTVLEDVDWTVRQGENWAVLGPNGAGKTTLLGLLLGDNPQAYAQDVRLFGQRLGRGISVRELRQRVGHVSPELQLSYPRATTALATVASGLFGSLGLYRQPSEEQWALADHWLAMLELTSEAETPLGQLAEGQQRLALLARAMICAPDLLVLDEPCQGLDPASRDEVHGALGQLVAAGHTQVLYVTHHPEDLPACMDRVLELVDGQARIVNA